VEVDMAAMVETTTTSNLDAAGTRAPNHDGSAADAEAILFGTPEGIGAVTSVTSVLGTPFEKKARRAGRSVTAFLAGVCGAIVGFALYAVAIDARTDLSHALRDAGIRSDSDKLMIFFGGCVLLFTIAGALLHRAALCCTWVGTEGALWFTRRGDRVRRRALFRYDDAEDCDVRRVRTKLYGAAVSESCLWRYKNARGRVIFTLGAAWKPGADPEPTNLAHFGLAVHRAWQRRRAARLVAR